MSERLRIGKRCSEHDQADDEQGDRQSPPEPLAPLDESRDEHENRDTEGVEQNLPPSVAKLESVTEREP